MLRSLKVIRKEKGITRKFLCTNIGIAQSSMSEIESGKSSPSIETRQKLMIVLGEKINWLDTPNLKVSPVVKRDWNYAERDFRTAVRSIKGLTPVERKAFTESAIKHLNNILTK